MGSGLAESRACSQARVGKSAEPLTGKAARAASSAQKENVTIQPLPSPAGELKKDLLLNQIHSLNRNLSIHYVPNLGDTEMGHTQKAVTVYR